jgi:hypothetical protein
MSGPLDIDAYADFLNTITEAMNSRPEHERERWAEDLSKIVGGLPELSVGKPIYFPIMDASGNTEPMGALEREHKEDEDGVEPCAYVCWAEKKEGSGAYYTYHLYSVYGQRGEAGITPSELRAILNEAILSGNYHNIAAKTMQYMITPPQGVNSAVSPWSLNSSTFIYTPMYEYACARCEDPGGEFVVKNISNTTASCPIEYTFNNEFWGSEDVTTKIFLSTCDPSMSMGGFTDLGTSILGKCLYK